MADEKMMDGLRRRWLETRDRSLPIARAVAVLNGMSRQLDESLADPMGRGCDHPPSFVPAFRRKMEERARTLGYPSLEYVRLHAEMRTSPRWAYMNLSF